MFANGRVYALEGSLGLFVVRNNQIYFGCRATPTTKTLMEYTLCCALCLLCSLQYALNLDFILRKIILRNVPYYFIVYPEVFMANLISQ